MKVEINNIVLDAMRLSVITMNSYARSLEIGEDYQRNDSVGTIIRNAHSECLSQIAIIEEFIARCDKLKTAV